MKRNILTFSFFLLAIISLFCQDSSKVGIALKVNPLRLINPTMPTFQMGAQISFFQKVALCFDYGIKSGDPWAFRQEIKKIRLSCDKREKHNLTYKYYAAEAKYFLKEKAYLSLQYFFIPQEYLLRGNYPYLRTEEGMFEYESSNVSKAIKGGTLIGGYEIPSKIFFLEAFGGIGFKSIEFRHSMNNAMLSPGPEDERTFDCWNNFRDSKEGTYLKLHLVAGCKLGIHF